ncbi:MAG: glutamate--tRNA ligase, partial [Burkholderiales bacterium]
LGLTWDERARQSDRSERYAAAAARLRARGSLYPCYETPEELSLKRKAQLAAGRPPLYDRSALALTDVERKALEAEGRRPHWRFKLEPGEVFWNDLVRGETRFQGANLSDPVLQREDGRPLYIFSSVVDDLELAISHVIRGEDHVTNTAVQVQLFQALGGAVPAFGHLSLLLDAGGQGLSKRLGSLSLEGLREQGLEPMTVNAYLAKLGSADPVEPRSDLDRLVAEFDLARFGRAAPRFDPQELESLNARILHAMPYDAARARLAALGLDDIDAAFWEAVRPNLTKLADIALWYRVCRGAVTPQLEAPDLLAEALAKLPPEPWDDSTWEAWTADVKRATGAKGKALFHPLRLALTGRSDGPAMRHLLPLIGRQRTAARLAGKTG